MFNKKKPKPQETRKFVQKGPRFKKDCVFCKNTLDIDYKNIELVSRYVNQRGRIISRRISGNCAKHQRKLTQEIKRARFLNLVPYVGR
jgi:small subunit ribosomal protein S18